MATRRVKNPFENTEQNKPSDFDSPLNKLLPNLPSEQAKTPTLKSNIPLARKPTQDKNTVFNKDKTITVTDPYGVSKTYKNKAEYEAGENINDKYSMPASDRESLLAKGLIDPTAQELSANAEQNAAIEGQNIESTLQALNAAQAGQVKPTVTPGADVLQEIEAKVLQAGVAGASGAALGSIIPGVGTALGGAAGIVGSTINVLPTLKSEYKENVADEYKVFKDSRKQISRLINDLNTGALNDQGEALSLYNKEIIKIKEKQANLILLDEKEWLGNSKAELSDINAFFDNELQAYNRRFAAAYVNPDPKKYTPVAEELE